MKRALFVIFLLFGLILAGIVVIPSKANADIIRYVKPGGTGDGISWATASGTLQAMINDTGTPCQIWVASGTYFPATEIGDNGPRYRTFQMKNDVEIYGGFPDTGSPTWGQRDWEQYRTVLSGDIGVIGDDSDNCYHIFYHPFGTDLNATAILDGFTLNAGNADSFNHYGYGGGMFNEGCSPTITNCTFSSNRALFDGGGIYNEPGSSPTLYNCIFTGNSTLYGNGGGMHNKESHPIINQCTFSDNEAGFHGGGIHNYASSTTITNCTFEHNSAERGGGIFIETCSPVLTNCTFTLNSAEYGGGIYNDWWSSPKVTNCILWDDTAVVAGNEIFSDYTCSPQVTYCNVQGGHTGEGNIDLNPKFVDPTSGDLHLLTSSPCINAGNNFAPDLPLTDFEADARIIQGITDMGIDESGYDSPVVLTEGADNITAMSAKLHGILDHTGGASITLSFEYGTEQSGPYPNETGSVAIMGGTGPFNIAIGGLKDGIKYYYRAKAVGNGVDYGSEKQFMTTANPQTWYVKEGAGPGGNGSSWPQAFDTLQKALDAAGAQDNIWVAAGTYRPSVEVGGEGDRFQAFRMKPGVEIYGGFPNTGNPGWNGRDPASNVTILSADIGIQGNNSDNCYHVIYNPTGTDLDNTTVLNGFTISGANADGPRQHHNSSGAGIFNSYASPTISNCIFEDNAALELYGRGGGMLNFFSSPNISSCTFNDNLAGCGGGIYNVHYSSPSITGCTFFHNQTDHDYGGGIHNWWQSSPVITNCTFRDNQANSYGGGISSISAFPIITNCTFSTNNAGLLGGGIHDSESTSLITNCIFWGDTSGTATKRIDEIFTESGTAVFTYCDIQVRPGSPVHSGTGNINSDPVLVNPGSGNFHLMGDSPCIDSGTNGAIVATGITKDFEGDPRISRGTVDMGVDEVRFIYVKPPEGGPYGTDDGSSWDNAFDNLRQALDAANSPCQIWVAAGTYSPAPPAQPGTRMDSFRMKNNVSIYGGFPTIGNPTWKQRNWQNYKSVLTGDIGILKDNSDNCYHVFNHPIGSFLNRSAILNGFTITGGNATGSGNERNGGGMYNNYSDPLIVNCAFVENIADWGGGMYLANSRTTLVNTIFWKNSAVFYGGGGIFNYYSDSSLINCTFYDNMADDYGGGIYNQSSSPQATNCIFWNDEALQGANEIHTAGGTPTIWYCDIEGGYSGKGNIDADPLFVNPGSADFHLQENSPCINTGSNPAIQALGVTLDFEGDPRIISTVDMGVDETSIEAWTCLAYDANKNSKIDYNETVDALKDYLTSQLDFSQMMDVLMCYLTG